MSLYSYKRCVVQIFCLLFLSGSLLSQPKNTGRIVKFKIQFSGVTNVPAVQITVKTRTVRFDNSAIKSDKWFSTKQLESSSTGECNFTLIGTTDSQYDLIIYSLEFSKKGYADKMLLFNTYLPLEDYTKKSFDTYYFNLDVRMAEKSDSSYSGKVAWDSNVRRFVVNPLSYSDIPESLLKKQSEHTNSSTSVSSDSVDTVLTYDESAKTDSSKKVSIAGNLLINDNNAFLANAKINLVTKDGAVVRSTTTNAMGTFSFTNIPKGEDYTIVVASVPPKITIKKMILTNKKGNKIAEATPEGGFKYEFLDSDKNSLSLMEINNSDLMARIRGKLMADQNNTTPMANISIVIKSKTGDIVESTKTDRYGVFQFSNIPADKNYSLSLDERDALLKSKEVFLTDEKGKTIARMKTKDDLFFHFDFLPPDQNDMAKMDFDDPWLRVLDNSQKKNEVTIIENLYYDFGKWNILPEARLVLDKAIVVLKQNKDISMTLLSYTDSRGTDQFNMDLSKQRADEAVRYISSKGIEKTRVKGIGKGEQELRNRCKDGIQCSEDEHAQNRRIEFKMNYSKKTY